MNALSTSVNSRTMTADNGEADMQVFNEIQPAYFLTSEEMDPSRYVLEKALTDCTAIEEMFVRLKRQQQVISNKALHLISQKRDLCDREFIEITQIQLQLDDAINTCRDGRTMLRSAKTNLTSSTFAILGNFRKRQIVQNLLQSLNVINCLRRSEDDVQNLIRARRYDDAVLLVLDCQKKAHDYRHFKCVAVLTQRLNDTLNLAEDHLDGVLASMCYSFDPDTFAKLHRAYNLLGKTQVAMDQLHMHFASAINISAAESVRAHQRDAKHSQEHPGLKDACSNIEESNVVICLLDLCDRLYAVMYSYYRLVEWHGKRDDRAEPLEFEANVNKEYIRQKLKNGLGRIWHDVQSKISTFLVQSGLAQYPFEKFVRALGILKRLIEIAEEFCGDTSDNLQSFIKTHSLAYIRSYHAGRMDVLRIFLENEGWEICPVRSNFTVLHLQEFDRIKRHIRPRSDTGGKRRTSASTRTLSDASSSVHSQDDSSYAGKFFAGQHEHSPFRAFRTESSVIMDDVPDLELDSDVEANVSDDEELEELTRDFIDETPNSGAAKTPAKKYQDPKRHGVTVTNTTLSVLRDCGQYLQMCRFLRPISFEVVMLMSQMYDYYLYSVHAFFASDLKVSSSTLYTQKLNSILKRIGNNLITDDSDAEENHKAMRPTSSQTIDLDNPENLHGLCERIVAVESLLFLSKQFEILQPYLESIVSPHQRIILQTFYQQTVSSAPDLRVPVYMCCASRAFEVRSVLVAMSQVNWEVRNVMPEHSPYVDQMVRDLQVFSMRLDQVGNAVALAPDVVQSIWTCVSKFVVHTLVEGFSNVSKCSDSGRGLMQLDYTQLLSKLTKISGIKPMPFREYVDTYVKAYYLTRPDLEAFILDHPEYSIKHLTALVNCASESRKSKLELIAIIEGRDQQTQSPMKLPPKN